MKNLFTLVVCALSVFATVNVNAQACLPDNSFTEAGLYPVPDSLDCFVQGEPFDVTIQFKNFDQVSVLTIEYLRIDSITNMPFGASYQVSEADRTFDGGQTGCIRVTGTTNDPVGQYRLGLYVSIKATGVQNEIKGEAGALAAQYGAGDFSYFVRVIASAGACPAVDTSSSANNLTATGPTVYNPADTNSTISSVNELASDITNFSFFPNPATDVANVSFVSDKFTQYTTRIVNIFGQEVSREVLDVEAGVNNVKVDVSSLPTGVYLYTINDGKAAFTHRFIVK